MTDPVLHGYFRSSAAYRVRIALNLKGVAYTDAFHHLRKGEQRDPSYLAIQPQGLVPALEIDGVVLMQSGAICEYLDERFPEPPLLPGGVADRARVRAFVGVIACDTHPLQNLRVLERLREGGWDQAAVTGWARTVIEEGLAACAALLADGDGPYCFGDRVTLADLFLVPQLGNARRFGAAIPERLAAIEAACLALDAFRRAAPDRQPDAE